MEIETSVEEPEPTTSSETPRLGNCEVCMSNDAKYTCPKCEVKFCCLRCSAIHKKELECDGIRDRTKFIPLNKFSNLDLSSDYQLLEEIGRRIEIYKKGLKKPKLNAKHTDLPHFLYKLRNSAHKRHTKLKFLPSNFLRHKENTTRLNFHQDVIFWRVDWVFMHSDNLKLVDEKVRETERICSILQKYFVKQENKALQEKLEYYQALGLSGVRVFMKAEEKAGTKYYELDTDESLRENLRKKVVIEYPTLLVVNREHCDGFDVIDSDDEDNKMDIGIKTESGAAVINKIIMKAESEDSINNSLKNLLFLSEDSDDNGAE